MDVEEEPAMRLKLLDLLADEHPVGAQVDDLLPLENLGDQLADSRVDHRLAPADRDHRRSALVDARQAFVDRQLLLDRRFVLANSTASRTGQVAGVQRLEHQDHRELFGTRGPLSRHVTGDARGHFKGESHTALPPRFVSKTNDKMTGLTEVDLRETTATEITGLRASLPGAFSPSRPPKSKASART